MKKITFILVALFTYSLSFGQIRVITNGDVGVGTTTPTEQLEVAGDTKITGPNLYLGENAGNGQVKMEIGEGRSANGLAAFELVSDQSNFPDFGLRFVRFAGGFSSLTHNGTSPLQFNVNNNARINFIGAAGVQRMRIEQNGNVMIGLGSPAAKLHVDGTAVKPGGGMWAAPSDASLKSNVRTFDLGLDELMKINPVYYTYNGKSGITDTEKEYVGVIAQEYQEVDAKSVVSYDFTEEKVDYDGEVMKTTDQETSTYLSVDYTSLPFMLVNAIQQQQETIEELQKELNEMKAVINGATQTTIGNVVDIDLNGIQAQSKLGQNVPNPFDNTTSIEYSVSEKANSASLNFYDVNGTLLKRVAVQVGNGTANISANDLPNGTYMYNLVVDGIIVDTKGMIITK